MKTFGIFLPFLLYLINFAFDTKVISAQKICNCRENQFCLIKSVTKIGNNSEFFYNSQCVTACNSLFSISNNIKTVVECCKENDCDKFAEKLASTKCELNENKVESKIQFKRADTSVLKYRRPKVKKCLKCDFCRSELESVEETCEESDVHYSCFNQITFINGRRVWKSGCRKTSLCVTSSQTSKTEKTKKGCCGLDMCNTLANALNMLNTTLCETSGF